MQLELIRLAGRIMVMQPETVALSWQGLHRVALDKVHLEKVVPAAMAEQRAHAPIDCAS